MSYVVKGRKADKYKMIRSVRAEINLIQKDINELEEMKSNLWKFRNTSAGKNGVEEAGKLYAEQKTPGPVMVLICPTWLSESTIHTFKRVHNERNVY